MDKIEFIKMHGLGNDFVIIDRRRNIIEINRKITNKLSDRRSGPGCDQIITIDKPDSNNYDANIKIFNPEGDEAEACGNGTRCVAKILSEELNKSKINLKSKAGILEANILTNNLISVNLGKISNEWNKIPLSKKMDTLNVPINLGLLDKGVAVNIGNPHIVFILQDIDKCDLKKYGPKIENHNFFPEKINLEIIQIIDENKIKMKVWERGVGITPACGSGACAAAYASSIKKYTNKDVEVILDRGSLSIEIKNDEAIMTGPAEISYKGFIEKEKNA